MREVIGQFDDLKERVIILWKNARAWHQWINNNMEVIEIHPGLHYKQFTDYFDFILNFDELKEIVKNQKGQLILMTTTTTTIATITSTNTVTATAKKIPT